MDKITGKTTSNIIRQLQDDRTLIKMKLPDNNFESLTIVTGIRKQNKAPFLIIDYPAGFKEAVVDDRDWIVHFEFTGRDNIQYGFTSSGGEFNHDEIMIRFPKIIERRQRRKHFRIKAPAGTKLTVQLNSSKHEMKVIDISMGGSFSTLTTVEKRNKKQLPFKPGQVLENAVLSFHSKSKCRNILVSRILTKRITSNLPLEETCYAFQFKDIHKEYEKELTKIIYDIQRKHLRTRLPLDR